jgi:cysteine desulfurase
MQKKTPIYLDNNATTKLAPEVLEKVVANLATVFGNPSSFHYFGQQAKAVLANARERVAQFLAQKPQEIIFTSSGTEAINMILRGFFGTSFQGHIITSAVEHSAVYNTLQALELAGCKVSYLKPGLYGAVKAEDIANAIQKDTRLITLMAVNNETGVKTDIEAIAKLAQEHKIPFVVDAVSLLGKETFVIPAGVSAMAFAGHKIHAPKGVGFAFVRKGFKLTPYLTGGNQEAGRRAGTEDVAAICGLDVAIELLQKEQKVFEDRMRNLRNFFEKELMTRLEGVLINGEGPRIGNTSNLAFLGVEGETLLMQLDQMGVAASHGSACTTGALEPSRILLNMGISHDCAASSLRFSLSRYTTQEEIEQAVEIIVTCVKRLRP